jgi:RNA polymerase sigma-B factor
MSAITSEAAHSELPVPEPVFRMSGTRSGLAGLGDRDLLKIVRSLPQASERRAGAFEELVSRYRGLVVSCALRYRHGMEPAEDLIQVGYLGLVKAISNFDPAFGGTLMAYAQPTIIGEIKKHFRDKSWQLRVARPVQELVLELRTVTGELTQELGRDPAEPDLTRRLGVSVSALQEAQRADLAAAHWYSLDASPGGTPGKRPLAEVLGKDDPGIEHVLGMQAILSHWGELPERDQQILLLRFYGDMTQSQVARRLGISQMHVSRLQTRALAYLCSRILGQREQASAILPVRAPDGCRARPVSAPTLGRQGRSGGNEITRGSRSRPVAPAAGKARTISQLPANTAPAST